MLRFGLTATALFLALAASAAVQAGPLDDLLTPDNVTEFLDDDDFESLIDLGDAGLTSGDIFIGMFNLTSIQNYVDNNGDPISLDNTTGGVKGFLVAAIDVVDGAHVTFRAVTSAEYADLRDGDIVPGGAPNKLDKLPASIAAGTALIVYQSATDVLVSPGAPFLGTDWSAVNTQLGTVLTGGSVLAYEFGFTDDAFAEAEFTTTGNKGHIDFRLALNVTNNALGIFLKDVASDDSQFYKLDGSDLPPTKVHISGSSTHKDTGPDGLTPTGPNGTSQTGKFDFRTDADLIVNAYPEPGSVVLLTLGGLGVAGAKLRRRKNAA